MCALKKNTLYCSKYLSIASWVKYSLLSAQNPSNYFFSFLSCSVTPVSYWFLFIYFLLPLSKHTTLAVFQYTIWFFSPFGFLSLLQLVILFFLWLSAQEPWLLALIFGHSSLSQKLLCDFISSFRSLNHIPHHSGWQPTFCVSLVSFSEMELLSFITANVQTLLVFFLPNILWCYSKMSMTCNQ